MKNLIFFSAMIYASISFAGGGGGGGGVRPNSVPENNGGVSSGSMSIIYYQAEIDGVVTFSHGTLENGQWQVQYVEVSNQDLTANEKAAIEKSEQTNQWVELK